MYAAVIVLLLSVAVTNGQVLVQGDCPQLNGQETFDVSQYLGTWYELKRFENNDQTGLDCTSAQYSINKYKNVTVFNQGYYPNGTVDYIIGTAAVVNTSRPAELNVIFPGTPDFTNGAANYRVISTDYVNYSLVYSCSQTPFGNFEFAWVLTRERGVAPSNVADLDAILTSAGVDVSNYALVNQDNCPAQ